MRVYWQHRCMQIVDATQKQLVEEETVEGLLRLLALCEGPVHLSTAVHRLARRSEKPDVPHIIKDARFADLVVRVRNQLSFFRSRQLANALWGFATLGFHDADVLRKAAAQVACRIDEFIPQHLSNTMWAFAKLRFRDKTVLQVLCQAACTKLRNFMPLDFALFTWSLGTQGWKDDSFFNTLGNSHVPFDEFTPQNMSNFAWGLAAAGAQSTDLLLALGREAVTRLSDFKEQELSNLVWAFATCDLVDNLLLHHVALNTLKRDAKAFDPQSISNLLWAYASLAVKDVTLLEQMTAFGIENIAGFDSQELANSTWATAMLMYRNEMFLDAVAGEIVARITSDQVDPIHLAQLMWAFSRFHYCDLRCIEKLVELTLATLDRFAPQSIIDVHDALLSFDFHVPSAIEAKVRGIAEEISDLLLRNISHQPEYKEKLESYDIITLGYKYTRQILDSLGCYNESFMDVGREEVRRWRAEAAAIDATSRAAFHRSQAVWRIGESLTVEASGPPVDPGGLVAIRLKHFRGGDAEFRALAQVALMAVKPPCLEIHVSEVPCLSCLGAMVQFQRAHDVALRVCFDRGRQCPKSEDVPYWMLPSTLANRVAFAEATRGTAPKDAIVRGTLTLQEVMAGTHKSYNKTKVKPVDKKMDTIEAFNLNNRGSSDADVPGLNAGPASNRNSGTRTTDTNTSTRADKFAAFYPHQRRHALPLTAGAHMPALHERGETTMTPHRVITGVTSVPVINEWKDCGDTASGVSVLQDRSVCDHDASHTALNASNNAHPIGISSLSHTCMSYYNFKRHVSIAGARVHNHVSHTIDDSPVHQVNSRAVTQGSTPAVAAQQQDQFHAVRNMWDSDRTQNNVFSFGSASNVSHHGKGTRFLDDYHRTHTPKEQHPTQTPSGGLSEMKSFYPGCGAKPQYKQSFYPLFRKIQNQ